MGTSTGMTLITDDKDRSTQAAHKTSSGVTELRESGEDPELPATRYGLSPVADV
jgi:hypothetical protein